MAYFSINRNEGLEADFGGRHHFKVDLPLSLSHHAAFEGGCENVPIFAVILHDDSRDGVVSKI